MSSSQNPISSQPSSFTRKEDIKEEGREIEGVGGAGEGKEEGEGNDSLDIEVKVAENATATNDQKVSVVLSKDFNRR